MSSYPRVEIIEEGMREGMQIESASIPTEAKIELLDALSQTGLKNIVVGSFVSPKWTPQMEDIDTIVQSFTPNPDVNYTGLALNERGRERRAQYSPPLSAGSTIPRTRIHVCDVFVRRNTNRSQQQEIDALPEVVANAVNDGAAAGEISIGAAWGSNWLGPFSLEQQLELLELQWRHWSEAGVPVTRLGIADPMAWNSPDKIIEMLEAILERWPTITMFHLHLHNARGTAPMSVFAALQTLQREHTLTLDTTIGGMGGCPYGGHGRATRMMPTEDLVDLLEELGIPTGVDLDKLIEVVLLAEEVVGHPLYGNVSRAGPRPRGDRLYPMDMPFIETLEEAQHFRLGPSAYEGCRSPWKEPISSPARDALFQGSDV